MSKRRYTHVQALLPEIQSMAESGKTQRKILEHYGFKDKNPPHSKEANEMIELYIYFYSHERIQLKTGVAPLTLRHSA